NEPDGASRRFEPLFRRHAPEQRVVARRWGVAQAGRLADAPWVLPAEVAFAAMAEAIVTHNRRDFAAVDRLGISILSPKDLLRKVK
ncbi:MAG: hypothetical protein ACXW34_10670, partial [Nitrospira sp.]